MSERFPDEILLAVGLEILRRYKLNPAGVHGVSHWGRVLETGLELAALAGGSPRVAQLFGLFHDSCRANDAVDKGHGARGAALARELHGGLFWLEPAELALLEDACARHTDGLREADVAVRCCWDADRLDLPRCGIFPLAEHLCTPQGRDPARLKACEKSSLSNRLTPFAAELLAAWEKEKGL